MDCTPGYVELLSGDGGEDLITELNLGARVEARRGGGGTGSKGYRPGPR